MSTALDLSDIQGNILRGYGLPVACHVFVRIDDPASGRAFVGEMAARVTTSAAQAGPKPQVARNLAVSAAGLAALGTPAPLLATFPAEFRRGMAAAASRLGDHGPSAPHRWEPGFRGREAHCAVTIHAADPEILQMATDDLAKTVAGFGLAPVHQRGVHRLPDGREHFGFADGFAQPLVEGAPRKPRPEGAPPPRWAPLPAGEFLLGYRDLDGELPPGPSGPLGRNGTYMVYREFAQDVAGFRRFLAGQAAAAACSEAELGARLVGRWPDGSPLITAPDRPDPAMSADRADPRFDDFGFADDPAGERCPLGAHIRRVNPRDGFGFGARLAQRHRMIRRGMPYGEPLPAGVTEDDGQGRGLAFVCFVAAIQRQFEFVQEQWCNDGNAFGLGTERDALVGSVSATGASNGPPDKMTLPGHPARFLSPLPRVVTTRGGEYFFLPGVAGLRILASLQ